MLVIILILWAVIAVASLFPQLQTLFAQPITLNVSQSAMLGNGWLEDVTFSPDGETLAVASSVGVWLYDTDDLQATPRLLEGHRSPVQAIAYSPDSAYLASAGWDDTVRLWDMATGEVVHSLRGHRSDVMALAFNDDNTRLLSGAYDNQAILWDVTTGEELATLEGHEDGIEAVAIMGDTLITTGRDGTLRWWSSAGESLHVVEASEDRLQAMVVRDGVVYVGGRAGDVQAWRYAEGEAERIAQYDIGTPIAEMRIKGDMLLLGTGSDGFAFQQIALADGTLSDFYGADTAPVGIAYDGKQVALATDGGSLVMTDSDGVLIAQAGNGHSGAVNALAYRPDGRVLASGGGNIFTDDKAVRLWDTQDQTLLLKLDAHASWIKSIAYSNDGMTLAIGTDTGQVMVYDAETGDVLQDYALHNGAVLSLAFAPDDSKLASGGADETIQIYDMQTGDVLAGVERAGGPVRTLLIDFDTDFSDNAAVTDQLSAFSVPDTGGISLLCSHGDDVEGASFNQQRTLRASSTYENDIQLSDFDSGALIRTLEGHTNWVNDTAFSPDGRVLASGSYDLTVRLWDVLAGETLAELTGHTRPVVRVLFSPDGTQLATASEDGSVRLWDVGRE
jgi:WD40 repeat protein